jgi:hypothetical protein
VTLAGALAWFESAALAPARNRASHLRTVRMHTAKNRNYLARSDLFSPVIGQAGILVRVVHPSGSQNGGSRIQPNPVLGEQLPETSHLGIPVTKIAGWVCLEIEKIRSSDDLRNMAMGKLN